MVYHGSGDKKNNAGVSLSDQDPIRLPVVSTKEYSYNGGYVSLFLISLLLLRGVKKTSTSSHLGKGSKKRKR